MRRATLALAVGFVLAIGGWVFAQDKPVIGSIVNVAFIFVASFVFFKILDGVVGMRADAEAEVEGLDVPEMGVQGYPEVPGPRTIVHTPTAGHATRAPVGALATGPSH